ncbi:PLP-dependent aminotransferase family protein [Sinorhizobium meliloti]|uniref:GntR2 n=2 Tax=Rhizobium meliloti TaxID=382 RepID=J7H1M5_RHIML|nr:PLP-dependent aminotransferase family protein [Sinorhizobium meliloti]AFP89750.1 GntR2 [Sinorhizobium meliloti]QGJ79144.1 aspartate aminotransferase [Sinorhizobium meliloti]RVI07383.1 PLP-dependent aminotransferase family protein [Sinorhizobium meliloti]RVN78936.1 PLP-dependent aminotransferase family protein [Sinorhizobium meliloti]RVN98771.1 PLP-dependent aminotransferase family protein [Sinorhizobium meliloti]
MLLKSPWKPYLVAMDAPPSERLVNALAHDIIEGRLEGNDRLPPHRDVAYQLSIGVGTVTKAYAVLERRGLIRSEKGRGTFVAALPATSEPVIDLSVNTPPRLLSERMLSKTLTSIARNINSDLFTQYPPDGGHAEHRRQMVQWLAGLGMLAKVDQLLLCNGAQQALTVAFSVTSEANGIILTEAQTYPGAISFARHNGHCLRGVKIDREGMRPDALDRELRRAGGENKRAVVYVTPTLQNPTTVTMGESRRRDIVSVCRKHDVMIIEDDVYSLGSTGLSPLAMLAPERTFYVNSLSKTVSPGLRIGSLVAPACFVGQAEVVLSATSSMVSPFSCAVMAEWLVNGTAESVRRSIGAESSRRLDLAKSQLGDAAIFPEYEGFHIWLPMELGTADSFVTASQAVGILVTPPSATAVAPDGGDGGIRLCVGGPELSDLKAALEKLSLIVMNCGPRQQPHRSYV